MSDRDWLKIIFIDDVAHRRCGRTLASMSTYRRRPWDGNPETAPDFWTKEIRRVTDVEGDLLVVFRNQDGETFVMDAYDYDNGPMP